METSTPRGSTYPVGRKSFFCVKFVNYVLDSAAAIEVGSVGALLLIAVVQREDSKRYGQAPRFWNRQFTDRLAISEDSLARTRKKCIDAGWLHYERGGKSVAGVYWVTLPPHILDAREDELAWYEPVTSGDKCPTIPKSGFSPQFSERTTETNQRQTKDKPGTSAEHSSLPLPQIQTPSPSRDDDGFCLETKTGELIQQVKNLGILKAANTIHQALKLGISVELIREVIGHFESNPGAWKPGALRWRLTDRDVAARPAPDGWPPMNSSSQVKASVARHTETNKQRLDAERSDSARRRADKAARIAENETLLHQFGPNIDALSLDDRCDLLTSQLDRAILSRSSNWRESSVKERLLRSFATRHRKANQ